MGYLIGFGLALAAFVLGRCVGLDRDRAFYPTVMIVVASYYGLFAVMGSSMAALAIESVAIGGFILASVFSFKSNLWLMVAALFAHGVFDLFHGHIIANSGVPAWWPSFCSAYDLTAAGGLARLLLNAKTAAKSVR